MATKHLILWLTIATTLILASCSCELKNLLRLVKEGYGLPEIKEMCAFDESVDELQVTWWRAVVSQ